ANRKNGLWIEDRGIKVSPSNIKQSPRIGVDYAGRYRKKPWRFFTDPCND
ncbi:MAG: DNA-3-methyladenine glycosylase, partial [Candidatus Sungbacteria bacterium]|nr:DNA-3-methyladenine glycosylase [Candidatus Sungbacteria bacterium]